MSWDPIGMRGFAQVFKPNGDALRRRELDQRDRQFEQAQAQAKQKQDLDWLDSNSKLDFKEVSFELQKPLTDKFISTKKQMDAISKKGLMGELSNADMLAVQQLKTEFDADNTLASSFDRDLKEVNAVLKEDKDGLYKRGEVATKLSDMTNSLWTRDQYGDFTINRQTPSPKSLLSDPDIYDDNVMGKQFTSEFSDKVNETVSNPGWQTLQTETKFKGDLFEIDTNGNPVKDPNTGKYVPKLSPENIAMWDSNEIRKLKLNKWSQSITKEGENWEGNRAAAFQKFVIDPHAQVSKKVQASNKPEFIMSKGEKASRANSRLDTLEDIVYNKSQGSLSQSFNLSDNIRVEFARSTQGTDQGSGVDQLKIFRREPVEVTDNMFRTTKEYQWKEYDPENPIWLNGDDGKESAIFKLNEVLNEAQPDNMTINQDELRTIFTDRKGKRKPVPKKSGAFNDF